MGINLGAVLAPLVCGYMAQGESFKSLIASMGFDPRMSWHWGFGAAGIGMTLGLVVYLLHRQRLAHVGDNARRRHDKTEEASAYDLLIENAQAAGANAILAMRYDANEMAAAVTEVLAYGTAVVVE